MTEDLNLRWRGDGSREMRDHVWRAMGARHTERSEGCFDALMYRFEINSPDLLNCSDDDAI